VMKRYEFVVTGKYPFPTDMLRYDVCSPVDSAAVSRVEAAINGRFKQREGEGHTDRFEIRLVSFLRAPTVGRWNSFGWTCELIREEKWS
jgi:hypothetical protein